MHLNVPVDLLKHSVVTSSAIGGGLLLLAISAPTWTLTILLLIPVFVFYIFAYYAQQELVQRVYDTARSTPRAAPSEAAP